MESCLKLVNEDAYVTEWEELIATKIASGLSNVVSDCRINILDSIMDMMEKYARNMEESVEERSRLLLDEKRKTDRLLYRLLPA